MSDTIQAVVGIAGDLVFGLIGLGGWLIKRFYDRRKMMSPMSIHEKNNLDGLEAILKYRDPDPFITNEQPKEEDVAVLEFLRDLEGSTGQQNA